jgi:magnesium chelatase subunit I
MKITRQEAWLNRSDQSPSEHAQPTVPDFISEIVERIAFEARGDQRVDRRSGVSQRLPISVIENVVSNAERRRLLNGESTSVARVGDVYAALPSITGKIELEYEGEQRGAANVARDLVRTAVGKTFDAYFDHLDCSEIIAWFNDGGAIRVGDTDNAELCLSTFRRVNGLFEIAAAAHIADESEQELLVSVCELVLEGLYAKKKISRSQERGYVAAKPESRSQKFESFSRSGKIN